MRRERKSSRNEVHKTRTRSYGNQCDERRVAPTASPWTATARPGGSAFSTCAPSRTCSTMQLRRRSQRRRTRPGRAAWTSATRARVVAEADACGASDDRTDPPSVVSATRVATPRGEDLHRRRAAHAAAVDLRARRADVVERRACARLWLAPQAGTLARDLALRRDDERALRAVPYEANGGVELKGVSVELKGVAVGD